MILVIAGLVILGPERLPGAIRWTANALRQVRDYVSGATSQLREEFGPEFDDLREPLSELQKLRGMTPRAALTKHLLDGDDSIFTGRFDTPGSDGPVRRTRRRVRSPIRSSRSTRRPPCAPRRSTPTPPDQTERSGMPAQVCPCRRMCSGRRECASAAVNVRELVRMCGAGGGFRRVDPRSSHSTR